MTRVLRWMWRQCWKAVLTGIVLVGALLTAGYGYPAAAAAPVNVTVPALRATGDELAASDDEKTEEKARERSRRGRLLYLGSLLYEGVLLFGFLAFGGTRWLARLASRFGSRWVIALAAVLGVLGLASSVLTFPLDYYRGFIFPHQYGLSNQTTLQWLRDYAVEGVVGALIGIPMAVLVYAIIRKAPRTWWAWLTAASVPLYIIMMLIAPVLITPLFNKLTPIKDEALRQEILAMAHEQGIEAKDVYQVDASRQSNAVNAYVHGFGPTLRIVLYDTLIKNFSHAEIKSVMAHEMGHYVLGHIYQGIAFAILGTLLGTYLLYRGAQAILMRFHGRLGFDALGNPASYPLLAAVMFIISLAALPIGSAFSRHIEWEADKYCVRVYPNYDAAITSFEKLAAYNLSDKNPPKWAQFMFGTHPTLAERITYLEREKARHEKQDQSGSTQ